MTVRYGPNPLLVAFLTGFLLRLFDVRPSEEDMNSFIFSSYSVVLRGLGADLDSHHEEMLR